MERCDYRFTRRQVCGELGWSLTQARLHLARLLEHELVTLHRGRAGQAMVYELVYQGEGGDGRRFVVQLLDPERLGYVSDLAESEAGVADSESDLAGSKRGGGGPESAGWRSTRIVGNSSHANGSRPADESITWPSALVRV